MSHPRYSAAGDPIWSHQERSRPFEHALGDAAAIERITAHLQRYLGPSRMVWHELVSDLVHVDVHEYPPTPGRPFITLVTSGMSDLAMAVPEGMEASAHAEVLLCLPPDWPMSQEAFAEERNYWPIRLLKETARFPHTCDTWLGPGHTVQGGDPAPPLGPDVAFTSVLVERPLTLPPEAQQLEVGPGKTIAFYALIPLHPEELRLKLTRGLEALEDLLDARRVTEVLDVARASVARRKWLRLF